MAILEKPDIRLIALDLDGTLFNNRKEITPHTLDVLQQAIRKGVYVVPATGRPAAGLPKELMALEGLHYAITSNGSEVADLVSGKPLFRFPIEGKLAARILRVLKHYDCLPSLFCQGRRACPVEDVERIPEFVDANMVKYVRDSCWPVGDLVEYALNSGDTIEKANGFFLDEDERARCWAEMEALPEHVVITSSLTLNMEINAPGVHKGRGLMALAEHLGLTADQVMACGDSGNDLEMIKAAGLGVAMGNATAPVLEHADYVTLSNEEDGVAAAVERFVL